jgi:predicted NAD/FAD-dependent oxidoreductase
VLDDELPVIVIGAGLAGLASALTLQEAGVSVRVLEASSCVGGRVQSDQINGYRFDRGFQLINASYPELKRLDIFKELDFRFAPRAVDVVLDGGITRLGDPRLYFSSIFAPGAGAIFEKFCFIRYLFSKSLHGASLEEELLTAGCGTFYTRVLKPFLTGVFLADPSLIDAGTGRAIVKSFISGKPGLPAEGAGELSRVIAAKVDSIELGVQVNSIDKWVLSTSQGEVKFKALIVATDQTTAAQLLDLDVVGEGSTCTTWYHSTPEKIDCDAVLRIDGQGSDRLRGPVINSLAISKLLPTSAPEGFTLFSSTTLGHSSESEVRRHLALMWQIDNADWELVAKYDIKNALPLTSPGEATAHSLFVAPGIWRAGDYLSAPSQNGALVSGRLAALELINSLQEQREPKLHGDNPK